MTVKGGKKVEGGIFMDMTHVVERGFAALGCVAKRGKGSAAVDDQ